MKRKNVILFDKTIMHTYHFTAQIEKDPQTGMYVGFVPDLPGAHTQAKTLDELRKRLEEVVSLCLEELTDKERKNLPQFVGMQQVSIRA